MKIALIGSVDYDSFEYNLHESFIYNGHQAEIFDLPAQERSSIFIRLIKDEIFMTMADEVDRYHPDLIVAVYRIINPCFVIQVKKMGYRIIHINPDPVTTFSCQQLFAAEYDVYFTKDPFIKRFMESNMKLNVKLHNDAFNIRLHKKPDMDKPEFEKKIDIEVMTYGTLYPYRNRMLRLLIDAGIEIVLFGNKFPFYDHELDKYHSGYYITGESKAKLLYGARIVLNTFNYAEVESVNSRFFEANGSGAFQLSDYRPILRDLLPIDPELVSFRSIDEAIEKIKYYLQHPEERIEIARTIYAHFVNNYTYDHLIQYLLNSI